MPDIDIHFALSWLLSATGMALWGTWLYNFLELLRHPRVDQPYTPYISALSEWVSDLSPLKMQTLSLVAFFVPLIIVQVILAIVPIDFYALIDPYVKLAILAVTVYTAQQWVKIHNR